MDSNKPFADKSNNLDFKRYLYACLQYKWRIIFASLFISIITAFVVMQIKPIYESTATLLIEPEQKNMASVDEMYGFDTTKREYYSTQFAILKSKYIALAVIKKLNLSDNPEFNEDDSSFDIKGELYTLIGYEQPKSELNDEYKLVNLINEFRERLTVEPIMGTQLVHISYEATDRKLAAEIANAVGEAYIETQLEAKMGVTREATTWMSDKMADLTTQLERSEAAFENFRQENNIVDIESAVTRIDNELESTQQTLAIAQSDKSKVDSILNMINKLGKSDFESLKSLPEIMSHSSVSAGRAQLELAELKYAELAKRYGPKHPKLIAASEELNMRKEQVNSQIRSLISGIEKESYAANERVKQYQQELVNIRKKYNEITKLDSHYTALKVEVDTNRNLYNTFLERSRETEATSGYKTTPARFTGFASPSIYP